MQPGQLLSTGVRTQDGKSVAGGRYPLDKLIKTYPAREMEKAVHDVHNGTIIKAVFVWD
jgi:hypothetical protein